MTIDLASIAAARDAILAAMGDDDDERAYLDTLDGETDVMDIADWLIKRVHERKAAVAATAGLIAHYRDRQTAHENALARLRDMAQAVLGAAGVAKLARPTGTISTQEGRMSVEIVDIAEIPTQLCKITRTPDKTAIKAALDAGETVPGAELAKGPNTVRIT